WQRQAIRAFEQQTQPFPGLMGLVARDGDSVLQNSPRPVDGARQSVTFETIKCRTLNSARLWEASMCQSDQPRVSGVVVLDSTQPRRCVRADLMARPHLC